MENLFDVVLDKDEQIMKILKPNKTRTLFGSILAIVLLSLFWVVPIIIASAVDGDAYALIGLIIPVIMIVTTIIFIQLWYNKTVYCITNKRVLIRTGFIGVDYKSLDFTMLSAITVNVNWIDKIINKNTGSIAFGSMASPITNNTAAKFAFGYIENPYETYKEIKTIIDEHKEK